MEAWGEVGLMALVIVRRNKFWGSVAQWGSIVNVNVLYISLFKN